jgi:hypothetical protein
MADGPRLLGPEGTPIKLGSTVHVVTQSAAVCWRCGGRMWELTPKMQGYTFYCADCEHLTLPVNQVTIAIANIPEEALGIIVAVPQRLRLLNQDVKRRPGG